MAVKAGQKLICGVGINDGTYIQAKGSDVEHSYSLWRKCCIGAIIRTGSLMQHTTIVVFLKNTTLILRGNEVRDE